MDFGDVLHQVKPQTTAPGGHVVGPTHLVKFPEYFFPLRLVDADAVVLEMNIQLFTLHFKRNLYLGRTGMVVLDRIGQKNTISIHVPYFEDSPTQTMYQWYENGLNAFASTCPEGHTVFKQLEPALRQSLKDPDSDQVATLISAARELAEKTRENLEKGRDHLLELSSCRQPQADHLADYIAGSEYSAELTAYLDQLANCYGLDLEDHSAETFILRPTAHMSVDHFPGLSGDAMTLTTHRTTALVHEDRHFVSWEHPMIRGAMDLTLSGIHGRTGMLAAKVPDGPSGLFLESLFVLEAVGPRGLQAGKFLPPTCIRVLMNSRGENIAEQISFEDLQQNMINIEKKTLKSLLEKSRQAIPGLLEKSEQSAQQSADPIREYATKTMLDHYTTEIQRLTQLQAVNPLVRDDEIEDLQAEGLALHRMLDSSQLRLDAIRLVVLA